MSTPDIRQVAEKMAKKYNPKELSPFPYQNIVDQTDDLQVNFVKDLEDEISGVIIYNEEDEKFIILVNVNKSEVRQHFTLAHELGHYFLHSELVKNEEIIVTAANGDTADNALFRLDKANYTQIETEANRFAATLIMPEKLVHHVWGKLPIVEECAKIFKVSVVSMSIRLEKLGLLE